MKKHVNASSTNQSQNVHLTFQQCTGLALRLWSCMVSPRKSLARTWIHVPCRVPRRGGPYHTPHVVLGTNSSAQVRRGWKYTHYLWRFPNTCGMTIPNVGVDRPWHMWCRMSSIPNKSGRLLLHVWFYMPFPQPSFWKTVSRIANKIYESEKEFNEPHETLKCYMNGHLNILSKYSIAFLNSSRTQLQKRGW